ncbi:glycyl-radical enzyme activating protein [bacterium 1XD42-8]|jgi:pyruvate formate lyase activating enzyme|nr:glycyl-radical enzyme activating protein [Lachnospiraceae bacterium]RKJ49010.1 glycyl-radical enzyme activating protein [bacterium 1XD42-8]
MGIDYLGVRGRIFDIQKFSIHDGPGIRSIVFLKGCMFRCPWCCNPESQEFHIQTMMRDNQEKVIGEDVTVGQVLRMVEQDRAYYRRSNGGMTLSGGECMCQPDFAYALLKEAREIGLKTAVETTGAVNDEIVERLLPEINDVLLDIKHMNPIKHKEFIGKDNILVLENAKKIAKSKVRLTVRVPVVPTFNDEPEEIRDIVQFVKTLPGVEKIHLLPYHRLGRDKYTALGRSYSLDHIEPLSNEKRKELLKIVSDNGLKGQIGG